LLNPQEFWTPMPLPSIAANDPLYVSDEKNNWSGQPQGLTYQRAIRALENYGWHQLVPVLGMKLRDAIASGELPDGTFAFTQQYDTITGKPKFGGRTADYGPAILAMLEYICRMWGVWYERDRLHWGAYGGEQTEYRQIWYEHEYVITSDGKRAKATIDGKQAFEIPCGYYVTTDLEGQILHMRPTR